MLLAIDTSAGTSVAVVDRDAGILAERGSADTRSHAELIGVFIEECLAEAGIRPSALSGVVAGMGPGPFTGLRVGIAAARAFAFGAGTPMLGVRSHDAAAFGSPEAVLVLGDARRNELYWSAYGEPEAVGLPVLVAGPGLARAEELPTVVPGFDSLPRLAAERVSAGALGLLAEALHANGREFAPPGAIYLRSPDVTIAAGRKRVST